MGEENSGAFNCVKISLIVLYVISIIAVVIFIEIALFGLAIFGSTNRHPEHESRSRSRSEVKDTAIMKSIILKIDLEIK